MHRADLTKLAPIAEAHYTDLYGNAIKRFHEKYKDAGPDVFVNFNPVLSDPRDKTILGQQSDRRKEMNDRIFKQNADGSHSALENAEAAARDAQHVIFKSPKDAHGDPVGTYCYPAEYVANHWFDVSYGSDQSYLRVLKARVTGDKVLKLHNMSREYFLEVMKKLNLEFNVHGDGMYFSRLPNDAMMIYEAIFEEDANSSPHFRVNSYGKTIFRLIQNDFKFKLNNRKEMGEDDVGFDTAEGYDTGYSHQGSFKYEGYLLVGSERQLSAQKQNERARQAGFDAIQDEASSPLEAVIHPNEPEQIIFLAKRAYDVLETFKLPPRGEEDGGTMPSQEDETKLIKKAAGTVAEALGDRISGPAWRTGLCPFSNLSVLRNWLATEKIEKVPSVHGDPTAGLGRPRVSYRVDGWVTSKGRLIVVSPVATSAKEVTDSTARDATEDAVGTVRVRPGELRDVIEDNLKSYQAEKESEKPHHRSRLDYNAMTLDVAVVGEWASPIVVSTDYHEKMEDLAKHLKVAMGSTGGTKSPFQRITAPLLAQYERALRKAKDPTPTEDPAEDASSGETPSATPAEPDDSAEHPAP
jgi:hypothetical protein